MPDWFPAGLKKLAALLPEPLYLVGGSVRNHLMGKPTVDFDLAAGLSESELRACLKDAPFSVATTSPKLGTLKIKGEDFSCEYTAFRMDSYAMDGRHAPRSVTFVKDLRQDAFRRDFTVNAIYCNVLTGEFCDPTGGIADLEKRILRTVRNSDEVFREDGLRLMRFVRFAATYGFTPDTETAKSVRNCRAGLREIAPERLREELNLILIADTIGGIRGAHRRGMEMLTDYGLTEFVLPELLQGIGVKQRPDYHKYDVYGHTMVTLEAAPPEVRLAALLHDIAKPACFFATGRMGGHDKAGAEMAKTILARLKYSKRETEETVRLVGAHMFDLRGDAREITVQRFVRANHDILNKLCLLMDADAIGGGMGATYSRAAIRLRETEKNLRADGVPFTGKELEICGEDLIAADIVPEQRGKAMEELFELTLTEPKARTREGQLKFLTNFAAREEGKRNS